MTNQHPLTDEIIENICRTPSFCFEDVSEVLPVFTSHDMRAATDWQLEQVIEWLRHNLDLEQRGINYVIEDLREAMRPATTTQEDN